MADVRYEPKGDMPRLSPFFGMRSYDSAKPGLVTALAVLGLNMLGDGLRDPLDRRLGLMR